MDGNGYLHVGFLDIHILSIIHRIKNLDIHKLSIEFQVFTIIYYSIKNKIINIYIFEVCICILNDKYYTYIDAF